MVCDILDPRCIIVNELIGDKVLAVLLLGIAYLIIAAKIRLGFDTTIALAVPIILAFSLYITGFQILYAIGALIAGVLMALALLRLLGNK